MITKYYYVYGKLYQALYYCFNDDLFIIKGALTSF